MYIALSQYFCLINVPQIIIFKDDMFTIPGHGWFMALFYPHYINYSLVGGFNPLKNRKVTWDYEIPN